MVVSWDNPLVDMLGNALAVTSVGTLALSLAETMVETSAGKLEQRTQRLVGMMRSVQGTS